MVGLYEKIQELCKENKINITIMCKETGVGRSTISELKKGRTKKLSAGNLTKLAEFFNVSMDYLLGRNEVEIETGEKKEATLDEILNHVDGLAFSGQPMKPESVKMLKNIIKEIYDSEFGAKDEKWQK